MLVYLFLLSALRGKLGAFSAAVPAAALAILTLVLNWLFLRHERRSLAELGFDRPHLRISQAALGFAGGAMTAGLWVLALWAVTSPSWRVADAFHGVAAIGALTFIIFNNAAEELVYRGYLFLLVARTYGRVAAVAGTSILFTLLHIQGGVPWPSALAGVLTSALLFAVLFVRWRSLPLVLAFHVGTNFMQELLGVRVTGLTLLSPHYPHSVTTLQSLSVLALVAVINSALAVAVGLSIRRQDRALSTSN